MTLETPHVTETEERTAAVVHLEVPRDEMQEAFASAVDEIRDVLADQGMEPAGPVFAHHLRVDPEVFDFEVGVPAPKPVAPSGRVEPGRLPAATVARTVYQGAYSGLPDAWAEFSDWIDENGHTPASDAWERYVVHPDADPDPSAWRTELNRPLAAPESEAP